MREPERNLRKVINLLKKNDSWRPRYTLHDMAMLVNGSSMELLCPMKDQSKISAEELETRTLFIELAKQCKTVIACRVSPAQKAFLVKMVKDSYIKIGGWAPITLAVGDGGNDVGMIQEAHVSLIRRVVACERSFERNGRPLGARALLSRNISLCREPRALSQDHAG